jgi:hypothetical protein
VQFDGVMSSDEDRIIVMGKTSHALCAFCSHYLLCSESRKEHRVCCGSYSSSDVSHANGSVLCVILSISGIWIVAA